MVAGTGKTMGMGMLGPGLLGWGVRSDRRNDGGVRAASIALSCRVRRAVAVGLAVVGLAACTAQSPAASGSVTALPDVQVREITSNLEVPWGIAFLPDGSAVVAERDSGRILHVAADGGIIAELVRLPSDYGGEDGEGGLLGLAVSSTFDSDQFIYAYHTTVEDNRVVRFRMDAPERQEVILAGIASGTYHNGGRMAFGPDGFLYIATGDAGDDDAAQDSANLNGKILRVTPSGQPAPGNPNPQSPVYSLGHRNVQGLAFDAAGRLYATEFGQNALDEINLIEPGGNYGWPEIEGEGDTDGGRYINPLVTWRVREASPSGAAILGNVLYVAALRGERIWSVPLDGNGGVGQPVVLLDSTYGRIRTVVAAPDGALWASTSNRDGRGDVRGGDDRILRIVPPG
jgi:glucose/arabinose dehydrogenase